MPREARQLTPDGIFHITARGNRRASIFLDDKDYGIYLNVARKIIRPMALRSYGYVLMPNHVHWVLRDPQCEISTFFHRLHGWYAHHFNTRHAFCGHVFQDRFFSRLCASEQHVLNAVYYTHENPRKAGLVVRSSDYPWSSLRMWTHPKAHELLDMEFCDQSGLYTHESHQSPYRQSTAYSNFALIMDHAAGIRDADATLQLLVQHHLQHINTSATSYDTLPQPVRLQLGVHLYRNQIFSTRKICNALRICRRALRRAIDA